MNYSSESIEVELARCGTSQILHCLSARRFANQAEEHESRRE